MPMYKTIEGVRRQSRCVTMLVLAGPLLGCLLFLCNATAAGSDTGSPTSQKDLPVGDTACGPRCVQFVLKRFGQDLDLIDLVQEIQWPEIENGATLAALQDALQKRGLFTFSLHFDTKSGAQLDWPYPAIVHFNGEGQQLGHFAVWLPASPDCESYVWTGLSQPMSLTDKNLLAKMSGAVLLTSPIPIKDPGKAIVRPYINVWLFVGLTLLLVSIFLAFMRFSRARTFQSSPVS